MDVEILGNFEYLPQPSRDAIVRKIELHSVANWSGIYLLGNTGDNLAEWNSRYSDWETAGYFTENDRVPQTRKVIGVDGNSAPLNPLYTTVIQETGEVSYPQISPVLETYVTAGVSFEIEFPVIRFPIFFGSFEGEPFEFLIRVEVEMDDTTKVLTIPVVFKFDYVGFSELGGVNNIEVNQATSTVEYNWDDAEIETLTAETESEEWADGLSSALTEFVVSSVPVKCRIRTPFFALNVKGGTRYNARIEAIELPTHPDAVSLDFWFIGRFSDGVHPDLEPIILRTYGTKLVAKTIYDGSVTRSFRPADESNLKWAYKNTPTSEADGTDLEWLYHDSGIVDFTDYETGQEWIDALLPELPDSDEDGVFSFFALVTDIWGASGMVVVQVRNAPSGSDFFVHPAGFQMSALKSGSNTKIEMWEKVSDKELLSTIAGVSPLALYRLKNGEVHLLGKSATGAKFYKSESDGKTWTLMGQPFDATYKTHDGCEIFGPSDIAIATKTGSLYIKTSDDNGVTWTVPSGYTPRALPNGFKALSVKQRTVHGEVTVVITDSATFQIESKDDGATWTEIE